jgi:hypothetical protein
MAFEPGRSRAYAIGEAFSLQLQAFERRHVDLLDRHRMALPEGAEIAIFCES